MAKPLARAVCQLGIPGMWLQYLKFSKALDLCIKQTSSFQAYKCQGASSLAALFVVLIKYQIPCVLRIHSYKKSLPCAWWHLQDPIRLQGSLSALRILCRKYEFKDEEDRQPLAQIVSTIFPVSLSSNVGMSTPGQSCAVFCSGPLGLVCAVF